MCSLARKTSITNTTITVICYLFVLLFLYAATSKLLDFETFTVQLAQSPLLSAYAGIIAWMVPGIEILIAVLLIFPRFRTLALYASFTLMVMFTAYIYIILNFSDFIPCSCGGVLEKLSWTQHLIFNVVFIVLAGGAILISIHWNIKRRLLFLLILAIIGIGIVAILFAFSEKKMHRNNAFQRRYIPHPIEKLNEYDLEYNSYYIAGFDNDIIYMGNYMAPLLLKKIDTKVNIVQDFSITVDNTDLPFRKIRTVVSPPYFYVGDGTVPIIFRGKLSDKHSIQLFDMAYYTQFTVADSTHIGITTISSRTKTTEIGLLKKTVSTDSVIINENLLTKQVDGIFDSDGWLLWNSKHEKFLYIYRYRNTYEAINKKLSRIYTGKTIDTISTAILDILRDDSSQQSKLGWKTVMVNKACATYGDYLYIESDRLGKFEEMIDTSTIIDVYNIIDNSYAFSFYIYHNPGERLREFKINGELLMGIINDKLLIYKLKPEYFDPGFN